MGHARWKTRSSGQIIENRQVSDIGPSGPSCLKNKNIQQNLPGNKQEHNYRDYFRRRRRRRPHAKQLVRIIAWLLFGGI